MCVIYPPNVFSENTLIVLKEEKKNMILEYHNRVSTDFYLMNFMLYASEIINIKTSDKIDRYIKNEANFLESKLKHFCKEPSGIVTDGHEPRICFEDKSMSAVCDTIDEFLNDFDGTLDHLSKKFKEKTRDIFKNEKYRDDFEKYSVAPIVKEYERLKKIIPSFQSKNLYVVNAVLYKDQKTLTQQILKIEYKPDLDSKIILVPIMHELPKKRDNEPLIFNYDFKFIGRLSKFYHFDVKRKNLLKINSNFKVIELENNSLAFTEKCEFCKERIRKLFAYFDKKKCYIGCRMDSKKNNNLVIDFVIKT